MFTCSKPPNEFFTIQKLKIYKKYTIAYNVMSWGKKDLRNPKLLYFLWLRPWFNSNVDAITTNLFREHAFCQASSRTQKQSNFCLLCHFHQSNLNLHYYTFLSSLGSVRVMARVSLAIRDFMENLWRNRFRRRRNVPCISREYSEAPRFLKAKSSAAENCG